LNAAKPVQHTVYTKLGMVSAKILVDLWNAAMALIAEYPNQRNHIEAKLSMR